MPPSTPSTHHATGAARWSLLSVILGAYALRVVGLDRLGLAYDEAATALMSRATPAAIVAFHWDAAFEHPPVWVLLMHSWSAWAGQSEFALRLLPAWAGTLLIPALWRLSRRLLHASTGLALTSAVLIAASPVLVYYSQEARMYTLVVLLAVFTTQLAVRLEVDPRAAPLFLVATWFMVGLHYYAALVTALQAAVLILHLAVASPRQWSQWRLLAVVFAAAGAPLLAWMVLAPGFRETLAVVLTSASTTSISPRVFFDDLWRELSFGSIRWLPPQAVWGYLLLPLAGAGALSLLAPARDHEDRRLAWLIVALTLAPMVSATLLLRTLSVRYILYSVPFLYVLVAWAVVRLGRVSRLAGALALVAALTVAALGLIHYGGPYVKSDYRAMAADLRARVDPAADLVVLEAPRQHLLAKYYLPHTWELATVPEVALPDHWPVTAPPVTPEDEDDRVQDWLARHATIWIIYAGEGEVDRGEFLAKYAAAVAYAQDCDRWLDVRVCHYVSPHDVAADVAVPVDWVFGGELAITGASLQLYTPYAAPAPQSILIQLDWAAVARPSVDVKASLRLVDATAATVAQTDEFPIGPLLPPTTWAAGDRKPGYFSLHVPPQLPAGDYRVDLNVYDPATLRALPPTNAAGVRQPEPHVLALLRVDDTMHLLPAR